MLINLCKTQVNSSCNMHRRHNYEPHVNDCKSSINIYHTTKFHFRIIKKSKFKIFAKQQRNYQARTDMQRDRERTNKMWNNCVISTGIRNSTKKKIECQIHRRRNWMSDVTCFSTLEKIGGEISNVIIFLFDAHSPMVRHGIKAFA